MFTLISLLVVCIWVKMSHSLSTCGNASGLCLDPHIATISNPTPAPHLTPIAIASDVDLIVAAWLNNLTSTIEARATVNGVVGAVVNLSLPLLHPSLQDARVKIASIGMHSGLEGHFVLVHDDYLANATHARVVVAVMRVLADASVQLLHTLNPAPNSSFVVDPDIVALPRDSADDAIAVVTFRGRVPGDDSGLDLVRLRHVNGTFSIDFSRPYRLGPGSDAVNVFAPSSGWGDKYRLPVFRDSVSLFPRLCVYSVDTYYRRRRACHGTSAPTREQPAAPCTGARSPPPWRTRPVHRS
jgi:hypothetical protein